MKIIVITEVERMMFRPNVGLKAQYVIFIKPTLLKYKLYQMKVCGTLAICSLLSLKKIFYCLFLILFQIKINKMCNEVFFFVHRYYACCFLNQIPLSHAIKAIASKLVSLYFSFFKVS